MTNKNTIRLIATITALVFIIRIAWPISTGGQVIRETPAEIDTSTPATIVPKIKHTVTASVVHTHISSDTLPLTQEAVKAQVKAAFADVPAMLAVVACESDFRQYSASTTPLISATHDVGVMQINIPTWADEAIKLNLDIFGSVSDNIKMGRIVYERQGLTAWTCYR